MQTNPPWSATSFLFLLDTRTPNLLKLQKAELCGPLGAYDQARLPMLKQVSSFRFVLAFSFLVLLPVGCREEPVRDTVLFEQAEGQLRDGDYEGATRSYNQFLAEHPSSPLAPIARQRLLNIDWELEAVTGRRYAPAPIYIRPIESADPQTSDR